MIPLTLLQTGIWPFTWGLYNVEILILRYIKKDWLQDQSKYHPRPHVTLHNFTRTPILAHTYRRYEGSFMTKWKKTNCQKFFETAQWSEILPTQYTFFSHSRMSDLHCGMRFFTLALVLLFFSFTPVFPYKSFAHLTPGGIFFS